MTIGEIKKKILKLIDEYSASATNYTDDEDYRVKLCDSIDLAQKQIALVRPVTKRKRYFIDKNLIGFSTDVGKLFIYRGENTEYRSLAAYSYYFEVDNNCTVKIYVGETEVVSIINTDGEGWKSYKGFISNAQNAAVRIVFMGLCTYHYRNVCLYNVHFPYTTTTDPSTNAEIRSTSQIPDYSCEYQLPEDFIGLQNVKTAENKADFYIRGNAIVVKPTDNEVIMVYSALPTTITDSTPDTTNCELDIEAQPAIVYGAIADLLKTEMSNTYSVFENKFNTLLQNLGVRNRAGITVTRVVRNGL